MKPHLSIAVLATLATAGGLSPAGAQFLTDIHAYAVPTWHSDYVVEPVLSVGDRVPRTSNPAQEFQMVGIPDGLGCYNIPGSRTVLNVNHEFGDAVTTQPIIGGVLGGGQLVRGAFVSSYLLRNADRAVLSGDLLFTRVYQDAALVGDIAHTGNTTRAFSRFCSAYQGGPWNGFDRYIYLTGEEAGLSFGATMFDPLGSQGVAIFEGRAHAIAAMGHYSKENAIAKPYSGRRDYRDKIVILIFEDGPATAPFSGVFLYVGDRNPNSRNPDPILRSLERNGLASGKLYYLRSQDATRNNETDFATVGGTVGCEWVLAPNAATQDENTLKTEMTNNDFFQFARPEDGHYNPRNPNQWVFATTGEGPNNALGRLYELNLNPDDPTDPCTLTLQYAADATLPGDTDGPLAPDNLTWSSDGKIFVQEDGTGTSRPQYNNRKRNSGIWMFNPSDYSQRSQVVQQWDIGRDNILAHRGNGTTVGTQTGFPITQRGIWETSGIAEHKMGSGRGAVSVYFFDVQAHTPTTAPGVNTAEDGQILFMMPCPK